jgi:hypothetical protein
MFVIEMQYAGLGPIRPAGPGTAWSAEAGEEDLDLPSGRFG